MCFRRKKIEFIDKLEKQEIKTSSKFGEINNGSKTGSIMLFLIFLLVLTSIILLISVVIKKWPLYGI